MCVCTHFGIQYYLLKIYLKKHRFDIRAWNMENIILEHVNLLGYPTANTKMTILKTWDFNSIVDQEII